MWGLRSKRGDKEVKIDGDVESCKIQERCIV